MTSEPNDKVNPYEAPIQAESSFVKKPYTRFGFITDLLWILFAAGPSLTELTEIALDRILQITIDFDTISVTFAIVFGCFLLLILFLFAISFVMNIVGSIKGRRMSMIGAVANIISLLCIMLPGP